MLNLQQLKALLQDRKLSSVAEATGLHPNTLREIKDGINTNPTLRTMEALNSYFTSDVHVRND